VDEKNMIERIDEHSFRAMKEEWKNLLKSAVTNEVFLSWEWVHSWWLAFQDDQKHLYILTDRDEGRRLVGIAPLYIEKRRSVGGNSRRTIRFCSSQETAPDHLDLICHRDHLDTFPAAVFSYLREHRSEWDIVDLEGIKENSTLGIFIKSTKSPEKEIISEWRPQSKCPYLPISGSFANYLSGFSGKTRNTLARKRKKLLEEAGCEFRIVNDPVEMESYIGKLFALHEGRTHRKNVTSAFCGDKVRRHHGSLINELAKEGNVSISALVRQNEVLAVYYCFQYNGKYYYYQTGISESGERMSAGTVLMSLLLEKAFAEGCREFDFLRGSENYKFFWTKNIRVNYALRLYKNTLATKMTRGLSRFVVQPGKVMLKAVTRSNGQENTLRYHSPAHYTVKVADLQTMKASKDVWNRLAASMPVPSIFCTWEWIYTWWEHFGKSYDPVLLFVYKGSELKAILPLAAQMTVSRNGWKAGRILSYCSSAELYPDHLDIISSEQDADHCIDAIVHYLSQKKIPWDACHLDQLVEGGSLTEWCRKRQMLEDLHLHSTMERASVANYITLKGTFEDFVNSFDKKQRYNLRSRKKKLEEQGFHYKTSDSSPINESLNTLFELHRKRAQQKGIKSTFCEKAIFEFHKSLIHRIDKNGWVSLRFIGNEKEIIAASYNFVYEGRVFSYQKGMDAKWERYGPGKAIVYDAIQESFFNGLKEYNFLQGGEEYKSDWTNENRNLFTLTIYNNSPFGTLSKALSSMHQLLRTMVAAHLK
jgi:CelD/BcsL family acetyltransferase involved in cellulose biosynthesis